MPAQRLLFAAAALLMCSTAAAQFPARAITLILPFGPGSGTDFIARLVSPIVSESLGVPVVVENRAGGNGIPAATAVAKAKPDGHTLMMTSNTTHSANPALLKSLPYDPVKDFAPVIRIGNLAFLLVVNAELPINNVNELIAHAKRSAGALSYGYGNSIGHVAGETLRRRAGMDMTGIPYKGTPPALLDVVAGRVAITFVDPGSARAQLSASRVRAIAVLTRDRMSLFPDLPSVHESGVPNFDLIAWIGVFAPAGTPPDAVSRLNRDFRQAVERPDVKRKLADAGVEVLAGSPAQFDTFVRDELAKWKRLIAEADIQPE